MITQEIIISNSTVPESVRELQKYNFRSKREFNYLLGKKSNTAITYIVHYPLHKQTWHNRIEFKPCTNINEEKSFITHQTT
jgi:hypothetical protein